MNHWRNVRACRRGLSTMETVGIVVALTLGVAAGFAFRVLPSSEEPVTPPEVDSPTEPAPASGAAVESNNAGSDALAAEMQQLKSELLAELRAQTAVAESPPSAASHVQAADPEMGQRTLAYWNQLNDIMHREEEMRSVPLGGLTASNARDFLSRRGEAGKFAADAIRKLSGEGVDPDVLGIAADIAVWYHRGNQLNGMGSFLLNKADASSRQGQPGQQWQDGEKAHHASVDEINRRGDEIRRRMMEKYGLPFPDLR